MVDSSGYMLTGETYGGFQWKDDEWGELWLISVDRCPWIHIQIEADANLDPDPKSEQIR